jgi:hypothetical protein
MPRTKAEILADLNQYPSWVEGQRMLAEIAERAECDFLELQLQQVRAEEAARDQAKAEAN